MHDWLLTWRGGEKVLAAIAELFPEAPIYTLFHDPTSLPAEIERHPIVESLLGRMPLSKRRHRHFLPVMPLAIRTMDVGPVDLVISSSHCVAKGIRVPRGARHLSYVHAPLRYMWDRFDDYFGPGRASMPVRLGAKLIRPALQWWDVSSSLSVDRFVANSAHVATQIAQRYQRFASILHPPVELDRFAQVKGRGGEGDYFLCFGALAPYKRIDLAIAAFERLGWPLWIGGAGQETKWVSRVPKNVRVLGQVPDAALPELYRNARALVFPGIEDFGLTPLEAQASGRPVIAFRGGGALETVTEQTGLFFREQTVDALVAVLRSFDEFENRFDPDAARAHAMRFSKERFQRRFMEHVRTLVSHA